MGKTDSAKRRRRSFWVVAYLLLLLAIVTGKVPNPLERFFEIDAKMYHTLSDVLAVSRSSRLQYAIKDALDRDGKLTQANMSRIWPAYESAIPNGYLRGAGNVGARSIERQHLLKQVGAHPSRVVSTFLSDMTQNDTRETSR